ncbi:unnamed protein product [Owenia fusiformis]|nr:unnamed protein product [Owenia fusiformis]
MEKFMKELAPSIWPVGKRTVFCYGPREKLNGGTTPSCNAKDGNPFGSFWDTFNIDFDASEFYGPLFYDVKHPQVVQQWNEKYSPKKFPVLAFTGAPAGFPVHEEHVQLHKYLKWSNFINDKAERFIRENIPNKGKFLGIHMRNGVDWERACEHVGMQKLFASPQCLGYFNEYGKEVTKEMCFPSEKTVLAQIKKAAKTIKASSIFVATDDKPMLDKISKHLKSMKVKIVQHLPADPHVDLAILGKADHYIGNCVSTFSAFAKRERDSTGKSSSFWGFERQDFTGHTEL